MAGRGQHYVPLILQRGFLVEGTRKTTLLISSVEREGIQRNIEKLWTGRRSQRPYSTQADADADGAFTKVENEELQHTVQDLRRKGRVRLEDRPRVGRLIGHLLMRGKPNLENMDHLAEATGPVLYSVLHEKDKRDEWGRSQNLAEVDQNSVATAAARAFDEREGGNRNTEVLIAGFARSMVHTIVEMNREVRAGRYEKEEAKLKGERPSSVRRNVMASPFAKEPVPEDRSEQFATWTWRVLNCKDMILSDSMVFFAWSSRNRTQRFTTRITVSEGVHSCYLPLTSRQVLMGSPVIRAKPLTWNQIREGVASTGYEYFIAAKKPPETDKLIAQIGRYRHEISFHAWQRLARDICARLSVPTTAQ